MASQLPLAGHVAVELARFDSSPVTRRAIAIAGRIAADLGATVIRILPAGADAGESRSGLAAQLHAGCPGAAPLPDATASFLERGKLAVAEADVEAAHARHAHLIARSDAVLCDSLRLPATLARAPIKVHVADGVPADLGVSRAETTDTVILALSGLLDLIGHPDEAPVPLGGAQAAGLAGLAAFSGLAAALAAGRADVVHVSALEACLWSNWKSYAERLYMGRAPSRQGNLAEWQVVPCADGFATLIYLEKDWPAVCRMIGDPRLAEPPLDTQAGRRADQRKVYDIVRPWYAARTRAEIAALARREGLPIAPVLAVGELAEDPQYAAQGFLVRPAAEGLPDEARVPCIPTVWNGMRFPPSPVRSAAGEACEALKAASPRPAPLAGTRVLDLGIITAGASTSALLADLGADVIKVESSAYIDPFRTWDRGLGAPDWWNRSRFFQFTNRNKRGLAIDLKHPKGKALFLDLVARADVVVENFRRGVLERLGLGWETLQARNPRLILCSITSQGECGPDAGAASYGSTLEANSGLSDLTRDARGVPLISGILLNYPDQIVSIYAAGIIAAAVMSQRRTGRGAHLDISQRELASFLIGDHVLASTGGLPPPKGPEARIEPAAEGRWAVILPGGARAPVRTGDDIHDARRRGEITVAFANAPDGSEVKGAPFRLGGRPFPIARPAPDLGEHNAEVLAELLGLAAEEIAELAAEGVLGTAPKP
jgi:benzylsuccinate CoA-transferase BbsF subunit